jgi:CubicO group peptidase (beta-lactamase class C family)
VQRLRFAHLLAMTAGWPPDETARRDRDDDLRWLARRPFVAEPGARFAYDNGAANLLALALAQAVGEPLADYARRRLFQPLGIERFDWRRGAQGHALGAIGLSLATPAMARLGELVLAEGQWQGRAGAARPHAGAGAAAQRRCRWPRPTATCGGWARAASWPAATAGSGFTSSPRCSWWWPSPRGARPRAPRAARPAR